MKLRSLLVCPFILIALTPIVLSKDMNRTCLYLFYGATCPHCAQERLFLKQLEEKYPELEVHEFEVYYNETNRKLWEIIGEKYKTEPSGVPMTFIGNVAFIGFAEGNVEIYDKRYKAYIGYSDFIEKTVRKYVESGGIDCPDILEINVTQPNGSLSASVPVSSPHKQHSLIIAVVLVVMIIVIFIKKFKIRLKIGGGNK